MTAILALLIALLICLPAHAQMAPPAASRTMPGQMANPMMMPNVNPNTMPNNGGNMGGGMGGNTGGNMGGTMMNPGGGMRMPYTQRMPNSSGAAAPSSGQRTTPSFVGLTRSEASALAAQYGLVAAFDGAISENARVASQAPEAGVLIFRTAMPIRFQMEAPASRPPPQTAAPATPAPEPQAASPVATPAQQTPTAAAPAAPPPSTPAAAPAKPAPAKPAPARSVVPPPAPPVTPSRNWWVLLAIAAGLAGAIWLLFGKRKKPEPIAHGFNNPPAGAMAQLATQIVSTGLAEAAVSVGGAAMPRFELRYVVERDEQSDGIGISVGGGKNGG